jgi:hypothetical protein
MKRFNLKKRNDVEIKEHRFAASENFDDDDDLSRAWKVLEYKIFNNNPGYYELKQHKPWFDEKCLELLYQRKQANCSGCRIHVEQMKVT